MKDFSKIQTVDGILSHVFVSEQMIEGQQLLMQTGSSKSSAHLHLSLAAAESLADALNDAIDFIRGAPARAAAEKEAAALDHIAGGESVNEYNKRVAA